MDKKKVSAILENLSTLVELDERGRPSTPREGVDRYNKQIETIRSMCKQVEARAEKLYIDLIAGKHFYMDDLAAIISNLKNALNQE